MNKEGRRPGTGKRGGDLAPHVARLSHPAHHSTPATGKNELYRLSEAFVQTNGESCNRARFDVERAAGALQRGRRCCRSRRPAHLVRGVYPIDVLSPVTGAKPPNLVIQAS